jgi:hypothetical protein
VAISKPAPVAARQSAYDSSDGGKLVGLLESFSNLLAGDCSSLTPLVLIGRHELDGAKVLLMAIIVHK